MKERLQEIAFDAEERYSKKPLSPTLKEIIDELLPFSDLDVINANLLINGTEYTGGRMEKVSGESIRRARRFLVSKYVGMYGGFGIAGIALYNLLGNLN